MEEGLSTIKKIKSNMSKICFNKSNKLNADFKDDHIEIILDNKNITPKPIYFSFQETETKKSFDQIDHLLKHFDDKNEGDTKKEGITESYDHEKIRGILDENLKISLEKKKYIHRDVKLRSPLKYVQDEEDILESYDGENKPEKDHQILDIITNEESKEDKINKINTLIIDDVLKNNCNEEKKKQISVKENIEKKRISYVIKKKEKFSSINGNRIKISTEVKQDDYSSKYNYDNDDIVYYKQNGEYNENRENNMLYNSKVKKYIKNISIDKLFQFHYKNLEKIVTSIDTNKFYQDYITASYSNTLDIGSFQNSKGNIAIFSFLNPTYPLKLYNLNTSVMKIKYSNINPNILVAALCNGHIDIYDIRNSDKSPVLKSTTIKNYYENCFEPIYDFSFKNSFAQISKEEELLNHYKNITENIIDKKIKPTHSYYYLGTKNGIIYRCNSCYQKSYLNYYVAHFGTVNKIKINKFDHDIFLSAGDDCTVKLWSKFCNNQITTFKSKNSFSSINDILWLPNNSTSFICCSDDGRVELWDFDFFSKDPLIIFYPNPVESSRIICLKMFNKNDILLCGDNLANVSMTKIKNLFNPELDDYEQKMKLTNCLKNLDTYVYF
ncbi:WD repeat-containing protein, putative [Plasmodium malariae]|uniref:WD repeat-containing protein, putative n=1 Tax=Plasmodium malariae TaxID=5858 RepID=A0A1C3L2R3_PLAMA|nr:WD repeat-containing protein, putative [Plasmodium malariae]